MEKAPKSHIALAIAAVFAVLYLFASYGSDLPLSPFSPIELSGPGAGDSSGDITVVADREARRALILDDVGELTGVVDCNSFDSPIETITDVCASGDTIYIAGAKYVPDSDVVLKERVAAYDIYGNEEAIVFEIDGESIGASIVSVGNAPGGAIVAYEKHDTDSNNPLDSDTTLTFVFANAEGKGDPISARQDEAFYQDAGISPSGKGYATLSIRGVINDDDGDPTFPDRVFTSIDVGPDESIYACDDTSGALCRMVKNDAKDDAIKEIMPGPGYDFVHVNDEHIAFGDRESNIVRICDLDGNLEREITAIPLSLFVKIRVTVAWICALILAALAITYLARKARDRIAANDASGLGPMLASVAVVAAVVIAIGSLAHASFTTSLNTRANEIGLCSAVLESQAYEFGDAAMKSNARDAFRKTGDKSGFAESYLESIIPAYNLVEAASDNRIGLYCVVYGKDDKGIFYKSDSEGERVFGASLRSSDDSGNVEKAFAGEFGMESDLLSGRTQHDNTLYRLVQIPSPSTDNEIVGVIEIGSKMRSFEASITSDMAQHVLALLVLILVVYLTYSELRACGRCLFSHRLLKQDNERDSLAVLTRPFTFCVTILSSIDAVMTVLIARELLSRAGMGDSSPLLGLPAVMLGVGLVIGQGMYSLVGSKVGMRKLMVVGGVAMILMAGLTAASVAIGNFWFYCTAKLMMSIPFGLLYSLGYSLPRLAEHDETRALAAGGVKRTDTSAAALGTVLGGYAAQTLGNEWVYALVAIASLPIIVMALNLLPRGCAPLEREAPSAVGRGNFRRFVRSRNALAIALLIVLPASVAAGYTSFIFPLFSSELGLDKAAINNIFVLGQLVVYVCIDAIDAQEARHGKWLVSAVAIALLGGVFLLFSINTTLVWSVIVIALVGVLGKSSDGWKAMWLHTAHGMGVPTGQATGAMFATRSLTLIAQPFILSALLGATDSITVIVIGAFCALCAAAFYLVTRKSNLPEMR